LVPKVPATPILTYEMFSALVVEQMICSRHELSRLSVRWQQCTTLGPERQRGRKSVHECTVILISPIVLGLRMAHLTHSQANLSGKTLPTTMDESMATHSQLL